MKKYKSILLVDDDSTSTFIAESILEKLNISEYVRSVKNGQEAIDIISKNCIPVHSTATCPEVIFLDLHMPVMDGFDFLSQLSVRMPEYAELLKIYILTSSSNQSDIDKVGAYQIQGYINKPLSVEKVKKIIR